MCIYHEAVRCPGVSAQEALALAVLPGFERGHPFLRWFLENPGAGSTWQGRILDQLAIAACEEGLLEQLLALPEEQGNGPVALAIIREELGRVRLAKRRGDGTAPKSVYHEAMLEPGLPKELVLAIGALPGYEVRQTCLGWYCENPGSSTEWQVAVLDNLAFITCRTGGLSDQLRDLPVGAGNGAKVVQIVRDSLGLTAPVAAGSSEKRSCCSQ